MTRDELRDLIIEAKELIHKLQRVWRFLSEEQIEKATEQHLTCDSCEEEDNGL